MDEIEYAIDQIRDKKQDLKDRKKENQLCWVLAVLERSPQFTDADFDEMSGGETIPQVVLDAQKFRQKKMPLEVFLRKINISDYTAE